MFGRVSLIEKTLFTQELSIYLKSAVPLHEALTTLSQHEKLRSFQDIILEICKNIENGQTLTHALSRFPNVFDKLYVSLVEVGEVSGTLPSSLEHLAMFLERAYATRRKIQGIFLYPCIVISVALITGAFITVYILPQLVRLFNSFQTTLPLSTRLLLGFSEFIQRHGWTVAAVIIAVGIVLRLIFIAELAQRSWQRGLLHLPFIGGFLRQYYTASFFHDMGVLLKSSVPVAQAFSVETHSHRNETFRQAARELELALQEGKTLWETIETRFPALFPPMVVKMLAVGERSGKLEETFFYLSNFFDAEVERSIKNFTILLEPLLLIIIGGMVAFIATAILTPIYSLTGSLHR